MQKIMKITLLILNILLLNSLFSNCYATEVSVTKENLNASLQEFVSSDTNENNYKITVSDNIITIEVDGKSYTLNYDLTEKPKFTLEIPIEKGMSYKDFKEQTDNLILPMIGYVAVANIQGIEVEDASMYIFMSYLGNVLNGFWSSENSYIIIDDTNLSEGVTIVRGESDTKTIFASEFGERGMEYVNAIYKDKQTISDATSGINSYEWIIERKDVTETSCKLVSSLTVNVDADFSKIKGFANTLQKDDEITDNKPSEDDLTGKQQEQTSSTSKDNTIAKSILPKTGVIDAIYIIMAFSFILLVILGIKIKKYKDIK